MPEAKIGLFCDVGVSYFLSKMQNGIAFYCGVTSSFIKGEDVVKAGFATHFVKRENLPKLEKTLYQEIQQESTLEDIKTIIDGFSEKLDFSKSYSNFEEIKYYFDGQKTIWDVYEKLENDKKYQDFADKTLETMK